VLGKRRDLVRVAAVERRQRRECVGVRASREVRDSVRRG
jgi:hypothetical protein